MSAAAQRLLELLAGKWIVAAITAAAELGVADALADSPATVEQLAAALDCHAPSLERLLGVLRGEGLLTQDVDERYVLTEVGAQLRSGALRELAVFVGSPAQWTPWAALAQSVRSGRPAYDAVHGAGLFEHLAAHPDDAARYDAAVDAFTRRAAQALSDLVDFGQVETVVDVGGGRGTLLVALLQRWPHLRGALVELPHVAAAARDRLASLLGARCEVYAGDFHQAVPEGADVYLVKHVLHNWPDAAARALLARCAAAAAPGGKILVVEGILLPGDRRDATRFMDLEMMVLTGGGRERRKPELRRLFHDAGLRLARTAPLVDGAYLLVGEPVTG